MKNMKKLILAILLASTIWSTAYAGNTKPILGTLVKYTDEFQDETGWSDVESATSFKMRRTWAPEDMPAGTYTSAVCIGDMLRISTVQEKNDTGRQMVNPKNPVSGFPDVFYYKID